MGRLCQNVRRRDGVYWFTKKVKTPNGWRTADFSLGVREPELAMMIAAQVGAQFYLFRQKVMSGGISISQFNAALAELAGTVARSRREKMFDRLMNPVAEDDGASRQPDLAIQVRADEMAGRVLELVARHGEALLDPNVFIDTLDANEFTDPEIAALLGGFYPMLADLLAAKTIADAPEPIAGALQQSGHETDRPLQPFVATAVLATVGKTLRHGATAAGDQQLVGAGAIAAQAVAALYDAPAPAEDSPAPAAAAISRGTRPGAAAPTLRATSVEDHPFMLACEAFLKRTKKGAAPRDSKDVRAIARLFTEFLIEKRVSDLPGLRQHHFAEFQQLFEELPTSWGKSGADTCLAHYRKRGKTVPRDKRGISDKTWNKHLANLGQILKSIRATGGAIGGKDTLDPSLLRAKIADRERDKRDPLQPADIKALFNLPVFTGCAGWERREPFEPGPHVYHRALYFAPMLLYYTGARRDEICGLTCNDVFLDAEIPYIHVRKNTQRRIKNAQSKRRIPVHSELLRLGFADYLKTIRALGYDLLFPDLYSATTNSPLGDRLYDEIARALAAIVPEDGPRKKVLHSLRHTVGSTLKIDGVMSEFRADLLGHKGKSVTAEVYATASLDWLAALVDRMPVVTSHLARAEINLIPWVARKKPAPWGRAPRQSARRNGAG